MTVGLASGTSTQHPALVITGASGFLGRHLIAALRNRYRIFALARRSQGAAGVPAHENVIWAQADVADSESLASVFGQIERAPGPKIVVHLAAHYDFTGDESDEYWRTNVSGLANVLRLCRRLDMWRFFFASSVAACRFPPPGGALTETSLADGDHVYAKTKRRGEQIVQEHAAHFPTCIVRFAALFSDWCEYAPLYMFLGTWLSSAWNSRILAGKGRSAIPYLHVRCAVSFFLQLLEMEPVLDRRELVLASTDGSVSHRETFEAASLAFHGRRRTPILMPKPLCRVGLRVFDLAGRFQATRPFERPWMGRYIDHRLTVDASRTRERLGWSPNPRLGLLRRMPFLVENLKTDPLEWNRRNLAALKRARVESNLRLYQLLDQGNEAIVEASMVHFLDPGAGSLFPHYRQLGSEDLRWAKQQLFLHLKNAVRTRERALFKAYCRELAGLRFKQGFSCQEVCSAFATERDLVLRILRENPRSAGLEEAMHDHVEMTFLVGLDEIQDVFEERMGRPVPQDVG